MRVPTPVPRLRDVNDGTLPGQQSASKARLGFGAAHTFACSKALCHDGQTGMPRACLDRGDTQLSWDK